MGLIGGVDINGIEKIASGKVREMFSFNEELLIVTTDRISAFDYILDSTYSSKRNSTQQDIKFLVRSFGRCH